MPLSSSASCLATIVHDPLSSPTNLEKSFWLHNGAPLDIVPNGFGYVSYPHSNYTGDKGKLIVEVYDLGFFHSSTYYNKIKIHSCYYKPLKAGHLQNKINQVLARQNLSSKKNCAAIFSSHLQSTLIFNMKCGFHIFKKMAQVSSGADWTFRS